MTEASAGVDGALRAPARAALEAPPEAPGVADARAHELRAERFTARLVWGPLAAGAGAVLGIARWLRPDGRGFGTHQQLGLPPCLFTETTGVPCPGCGLTTSFACMAHGQPLAAFRAHLMGPLLFTLTVWFALYGAYAFARARAPAQVLASRWTTPTLAVTALAGVTHFALRLAGVLPAP